jgi:hypothetical protein
MLSSTSKFCRYTLTLKHSQELYLSPMLTARLRQVVLSMVSPVPMLHLAKLPKRHNSLCFVRPVANLLRRVA